jgi:hypothetical protein
VLGASEGPDKFTLTAPQPILRHSPAALSQLDGSVPPFAWRHDFGHRTQPFPPAKAMTVRKELERINRELPHSGRRGALCREDLD